MRKYQIFHDEIVLLEVHEFMEASTYLHDVDVLYKYFIYKYAIN